MGDEEEGKKIKTERKRGRRKHRRRGARDGRGGEVRERRRKQERKERKEGEKKEKKSVSHWGTLYLVHTDNTEHETRLLPWASAIPPAPGTMFYHHCHHQWLPHGSPSIQLHVTRPSMPKVRRGEPKNTYTLERGSNALGSTLVGNVWKVWLKPMKDELNCC